MQTALLLFACLAIARAHYDYSDYDTPEQQDDYYSASNYAKVPRVNQYEGHASATTSRSSYIATSRTILIFSGIFCVGVAILGIAVCVSERATQEGEDTAAAIADEKPRMKGTRWTGCCRTRTDSLA